jgi:hypothetical protein
LGQYVDAVGADNEVAFGRDGGGTGVGDCAGFGVDAGDEGGEMQDAGGVRGGIGGERKVLELTVQVDTVGQIPWL